MFETSTPTADRGESEYGRRRRWRRRRRYYDGDEDQFAQAAGEYEDESGEYEDEGEDAGEEQFLPLIAAGLKLLPTILGGLGSLGGRKEAEFEGEWEGEDEGEEETGEAEEQFLGKLLEQVPRRGRVPGGGADPAAGGASSPGSCSRCPTRTS